MLLTTLIAGLFGALLMYCGDMTLYYDPRDYKNDGTLEPIIRIMRELPPRRVMIGGWIGPVAAFLYCVGFGHIVLAAAEADRAAATAAFLLCCLGIITGGAYHSHCAYLGLLGGEEHRAALDVVMKYFLRMSAVLYGGEGLGLLIYVFLLASGRTLFPAWLAALSPAALFLLTPLVRRLPKGPHMAISGGWSNLIFVIYYIAALAVFAAK